MYHRNRVLFIHLPVLNPLEPKNIILIKFIEIVQIILETVQWLSLYIFKRSFWLKTTYRKTKFISNPLFCFDLHL